MLHGFTNPARATVCHAQLRHEPVEFAPTAHICLQAPVYYERDVMENRTVGQRLSTIR